LDEDGNPTVTEPDIDQQQQDEEFARRANEKTPDGESDDGEQVFRDGFGNRFIEVDGRRIAVDGSGKRVENGVRQGSLSGKPARTNSSNSEVIRGIRRENEAAKILADNGYDIFQNPGKNPNGTDPDLLLDGVIFDVLSPSSPRVRNIGSRIEDKVVREQARNIVVNLRDTDVSPSEVIMQLRTFPIKNLESIIIIDKSGTPLPPESF